MIAKVLTDNLTKSALEPEWGLSLYLEYEGRKILLDTGASGRFLKNADACGIPIEQVEFGVLSHAHYDHADGMGAFFARNQNAVFYLQESCREDCYGKKGWFHKYIGLHRGFLKKYHQRIRYVSGDKELFPGIRLIPHHTEGLEKIARSVNLYRRQGRKLVPDSFSHEQSLVFETDQGLVIFSSCSHGGVDNIIREVQEACPGTSIYAMVGGFHLFKTPAEEVRALAGRIRETGIQRLYTGHCTGQKAFDILREELGDAVVQLYTGMEIVL